MKGTLKRKENQQMLNTERTEILEFSDKDCKSAIIKMLQRALMNTLKANL